MDGEDEEEDLLTPSVSSDHEELTDDEESPPTSRLTRPRLKLTPISDQFVNRLPTNPSRLAKHRLTATTLLVIIFSTCLLILFPLYTNSVNIKGDAYTAILFLCSASTCVFFAFACIFGMVYGFKPMLCLPFPIRKLSRVSLIFGLSVILIVYALDRNRVMCHLQDPIKAIVLVFSLVCYFCFCRKMLGFPTIVCCTVMVVGLFVSVDYGLCNEFRCRGHERQNKLEDSGAWSWQAHAGWTMAYVVGLALWTVHFTMLEEMIRDKQSFSSTSQGGSGMLLSTVSRQVDQVQEPPCTSVSMPTCVYVVRLALWLHLVSLVLAVSLSWTDAVHFLVTPSEPASLWNVTSSGLTCLLRPTPECTHASLLAWVTLVAYVGFTVMTLHMLHTSQSSVITVATTTAALPLAAIFWAFVAIDNSGVSVVWSPAVTGELICSILGLPIVSGALYTIMQRTLTEHATNQLRCIHDRPNQAL